MVRPNGTRTRVTAVKGKALRLLSFTRVREALAIQGFRSLAFATVHGSIFDVYSTCSFFTEGGNMARALSEAPITTANARSKLEPGEYARRLDADAAVWYRKGKRGGIWFARWRNWGPGANYKQAPIGPANDLNDKQTDGLFTFLQAERQARTIVAEARQESAAAADGPAPTVQSAVEAYIADRDARDSRRKGRTDAIRRRPAPSAVMCSARTSAASRRLSRPRRSPSWRFMR